MHTFVTFFDEEILVEQQTYCKNIFSNDDDMALLCICIVYQLFDLLGKGLKMFGPLDIFLQN